MENIPAYPSAHQQTKDDTWLRQVEFPQHGSVSHSSMSTSQYVPVIPTGHRHTKEPSRFSHVEFAWHGLVISSLHSLMSTSQCWPVHPSGQKQRNDPCSFKHVEFSEHGLAVAHSSMSSHKSPDRPSAQTHSNVPGTLTQEALL